jgi:tetratricopeptide (TPR) repeat protein
VINSSRIKIKPFITALLLLFNIAGISQQSVIDSLERVLATTKNDSAKLPLLSILADEYVTTNPAKAIASCQQLLQLSEKLKIPKGIANAYVSLGNIEHGLGNYNKALEYYFKSIKVAEENGFDRLIGNNLVNIGGIYVVEEQPDKAFPFFEKAIAIYEKLGDKKRLSAAINNTAAAYNKKGNYEKASEYFFKALRLKEELKDKRGMTYALVNLGENYFKLKNYQKAAEYTNRAIYLADEIGDKYLLATAYINLADLYTDEGKNLNAALEYAQKCLVLAKELNYKNEMRKAYELFAKVYAKQRDFEQAYTYYKLYTEVKDSMFNEQSQKQISEMEAKYQAEKKDIEIHMLNTDKALSKAELEKQTEKTARQSVLKNAFIVGFSLVLVFAFFVFRSFRQKQKANVEISKQKEIIEEKQKAILDSIHYAERIQKALITSEKYIKRNLKKLNGG